MKAKFVYILNGTNIIGRFRIGDRKSDEFQKIFNIKSFSPPKLKVNHLEVDKNILKRLTDTLTYYLTIRNNKAPDYGVEWKGRFEREDMFIRMNVLGNDIELFQGNEDVIIIFLNSILNELSVGIKVTWITCDNHSELVDFISVNTNKTVN